MHVIDDLHVLYGTDVPEHIRSAREQVLEVLSQRSAASVQFMANFGPDTDAALFYGTPTVRGVVVTVPLSFVFRQEDSLWLPPNLNKIRCRVSDKESMHDPGLFGDVVGVYHDATGAGFDGKVPKTYITDVTWRHAELRDKLLAGTCTMADVIDATEGNTTYNDLRTDGQYVYVFNHAMRVRSGETALVAAHPLRGYTEVVANRDTNIPTDFGYNQWMKWEDIDTADARALYDKCKWRSSVPFNVRMMRKCNELDPTMLTQWYAHHGCSPARSWITSTCVLSDNDVRSNLSTSQMTRLIPPERIVQVFPREGADPRVPVPFSKVGEILRHYSELRKLCPDLQIFHPDTEGEDENYLFFPRHVVEIWKELSNKS